MYLLFHQFVTHFLLYISHLNIEYSFFVPAAYAVKLILARALKSRQRKVHLVRRAQKYAILLISFWKINWIKFVNCLAACLANTIHCALLVVIAYVLVVMVHPFFDSLIKYGLLSRCCPTQIGRIIFIARAKVCNENFARQRHGRCVCISLE